MLALRLTAADTIVAASCSPECTQFTSAEYDLSEGLAERTLMHPVRMSCSFDFQQTALSDAATAIRACKLYCETAKHIFDAGSDEQIGELRSEIDRKAKKTATESATLNCQFLQSLQASAPVDAPVLTLSPAKSSGTGSEGSCVNGTFNVFCLFPEDTPLRDVFNAVVEVAGSQMASNVTRNMETET